MKYFPLLATAAALSLVSQQSTSAAISAGLVSDFEDGTTQNWSGGSSPVNITTGGSTGAGDNFLQIGDGGNMATFNTILSGAIDSAVTGFQVDLMRPSSDVGALDIRLVLFGPGTGNRWTSTTAEVVPNDDVWRTYTFPLLESDLTQVQGADTYANLSSTVNRVMFRHDPDTPSANGGIVSGTLGIDNVTAVPEPQSVLFLLLSGFLITARRRVR